VRVVEHAALQQRPNSLAFVAVRVVEHADDVCQFAVGCSCSCSLCVVRCGLWVVCCGL
jgi:hypothetical protein